MNARIRSLSVAARKRPRPHQLKALAGINAELAVADRAKVIQACGTGKTLGAMWAVQEQRARTALVLVPTLALMAQTLREWRAEHSFEEGFRHICVCSDSTIDTGDDIVLSEAERREYRACTDAGSVRAFLDGALGPYAEAPLSVVFSTYHSAAVVGEALRATRSMSAFDIAIFDEAHKTVGAEGKRNGFALLDRNLPIRKRVFFTATEKIVERARSTDEAGNASVLSMDNTALYGQMAYQLGFAEAADRGLIAPFQVIGSFVNDAMLSAEELGSPAAKRIADTRSLLHAMKKVGARKAITFHHRVIDAQHFAAGVSEIPTFHVNGKQTSRERERTLAAFAAAPEGLMTNAQCLTEGIDVPSVDMVAFMDPRQASSDIVQIAGRALRLSPGKQLGYVFVPLHVDTAGGETVEQAIARGDFRQVMAVLQSLTENDGVPVPWLTRLQDALKGGGGVNAEPLLRLTAEGRNAVDVERIVRALSARILSFVAPKSFDTRVQELEDFKGRFGHCKVPVNYPGGLGVWAANERQSAKQSAYPENRRIRLKSLGFVWSVLDTEWDARYGELKAFFIENGHSKVPSRQPGGLGMWVANQRADAKLPEYPSDRRALLDALKFEWDTRDAAWSTQYENLSAFRKQHGHCNVPADYGNGQLGVWVRTQREAAKKEGYPKERHERLSEIGFVWDLVHAEWDRQFGKLAAYQFKHGHCDVSSSEDRKLREWIGTQRQAGKGSGYSDERRRKLNSLGFIWNTVDAEWAERLEELSVYRADTGHCAVPLSHPGGLGTWVAGQRKRARRPSYPQERRAQLETLGFVWSPSDAEWSDWLAQLKAYRDKHGHCSVPMNYPGGLGTWATNQRQMAKSHALREDRRAQLDTLGFVWDMVEEGYAKRLEQLLAFHHVNGHCRVPYGYPNGLGHWVQVQRRLAKSPEYPTARRTQLDALGFMWGKSVGLPKRSAPEQLCARCQPWAGFERVSLSPLIELRRKYREASGLRTETVRQIMSLFTGPFGRLKDMELVRFDELDADGHAELIALAREFAGISISIHSDIDDQSTEEDEENERPRG